MAVRPPSELLHASADTIIATVAAGLVFLVFYPLTLCAGGVKLVARSLRPRPRGERGHGAIRPAERLSSGLQR